MLAPSESANAGCEPRDSVDLVCEVCMARSAKESIGETFGRLTVIGVGHAILGKRMRAVVTAKCSCGRMWVGEITPLRSGETKSCGCWNIDALTNRNRTHGMSGTAEHNTWKAIKKRCYSASAGDFHLYQGKGIKVCERWIDSFENFYSDMGAKPSAAHSIERRDSSKDYEPSNCYWATPLQQARNTSRNVIHTYKGCSKTLKEWCDELHLPFYSIKSRIADGWPVSKAFETPVKQINQGNLIEFDGASLTASDWSRRLGIGLNTILHRLKSGWSVTKTLSTPVDLSKSRQSRREQQ